MEVLLSEKQQVINICVLLHENLNDILCCLSNEVKVMNVIEDEVKLTLM